MHLSEEKLNLLFDSELGPGEAKIARAHLVECAECAKKFARLERLNALVNAHVEEQVSAAGVSPDSSAMWKAVQGKLARSEQAGFGERFKVYVGEVVEHRKGVWIPMTAGVAIAAAVAIAIVAAPRPAEQAIRLKARKAPVAYAAKEQAEDASAPVAVEQVQKGSQVEEVDFGSNAGTVFQVPGDDGATLAVVWINDEGEEP